MSRFLFAVGVYKTTGSATAKDHDGSMWTNPDYPVGTVLALDADGEWYRHTYPNGIQEADEVPRPRGGKIRLFRDYWCVACLGGPKDTSPYTLSILNAPKCMLVGV